MDIGLRKISGCISFYGMLLTVFLASGCGSFVQSFINTQKEVDFKNTDYADPVKIAGAHLNVYWPEETTRGEASHGGHAISASLLEALAPILVQGVEESGKYPADSDAIGSPELRKNPAGGYLVDIHPERPVLYGSVEKTRVQGVDLTQLVYVFWYPRHPVGMVEKGDIDGGVLRVTLDAAGRPSIFEYVMACGCWHGVFVDDHVEQWAAQEFGSKVPGRKWQVETKVDNEDDWRVREIVQSGGKIRRPMVFISAGEHRCVGLQTDRLVHNLEKYPGKNYHLAAYEDLEHLPLTDSAAGGTASMFSDDGLVWGARRKSEEKLFSKLDHGGWPRRLNAMKIHWDEEAWNNSGLLEKFLRLPRKITDPQAGLDTTKEPPSSAPSRRHGS